MKTIIIVAIALSIAAAVSANRVERIVGGEVAEKGQFPYQVSLRLRRQVLHPSLNVNVTVYSHYCGGSILSERWAITAAHCTRGERTKDTVIVAGAHHINNDGIRYPVAEIVSHPDFSSNLENDISLLRTKWAFQFNIRVQPIGLSRHEADLRGQAVVSGWGRTGANATAAENLKFVNLALLSNEDCRQRLNDTQWVNRIFESTICTYLDNGLGTCFGDSGGPLVSNNSLTGLVSWGVPCAIGQPDMFTRVSSFIDWIVVITGVHLVD